MRGFFHCPIFGGWNIKKYMVYIGILVYTKNIFQYISSSCCFREETLRCQGSKRGHRATFSKAMCRGCAAKPGLKNLRNWSYPWALKRLRMLRHFNPHDPHATWKQFKAASSRRAWAILSFLLVRHVPTLRCQEQPFRPEQIDTKRARSRCWFHRKQTYYLLKTFTYLCSQWTIILKVI